VLKRQVEIVLLCLAAFGLFPPALAEPAQARWGEMRATVFKHVPAPLTSSMAQDRRGFMWMATQSGLIRWDGYTSRVYKADSKRPRARGQPGQLVDRNQLGRHGPL
jgi:hypothetical protein